MSAACGDVVEMEDRPYTIDAVLIYAQKGTWQTRESVHRLHVRFVGRRRVGAICEGLQRSEMTRKFAKSIGSFARTPKNHLGRFAASHRRW